MAHPTDDIKSELTERYQACFRKIADLANTRAQPLESGSIPQTEFRHFYNAVQQARVTVDDFKLAAILKDIGADDLSKSPDLYELHHRLWGTIQ